MCVLFDENRQTELTKCPREQIVCVGVWIQIIIIPGSKRGTEATVRKEAGLCGHTPSSRAKQHIGKRIMGNSGRSTNQLLDASRHRGCTCPDGSGWTLLPASTYRCICAAAIILEHQQVEIIHIQMRGLNINVFQKKRKQTNKQKKTSANILASAANETAPEVCWCGCKNQYEATAAEIPHGSGRKCTTT